MREEPDGRHEDRDTTGLRPELWPLAGLLGVWRARAVVHDVVPIEGAGIVRYQPAPGGYWIVHDADIELDGERVRSHQVIGGWDPSRQRWRLYDFNTGPRPGEMTVTQDVDGVLLLAGRGARSTHRVTARKMAASWQRLEAGAWIPWMNLTFERLE